MLANKLTIAVTGINATDNPGSGMAVIRSLREATSFRVRIIGLSYELLEPGNFKEELIDKIYLLPLPSAGQPVLLDRFQEINEQEDIDFLFPNFDAELYNFIKQRELFENQFQIKMVLPTATQFEERSKVNLYELGQKYEIDVAKSDTCLTEGELEGKIKEFGFPVVIKGKFYDAKVVYTNEQAQTAFQEISAEWGVPIVIQEFISGMEVNVCAIGDGSGRLLGAVPMRKLDITDKGKAWSGVTLQDEELLEITASLVKKTKWEGPLELEFMKTEAGAYYLLEINPRFPAWCYLATGAGQNQVETIVNLGMGIPIKQTEEYQVGKMFVRYSEDIIIDIKKFEQLSMHREL